MSVLVSTLCIHKSCHITKRAITQQSLFYLCENEKDSHPVLKEYCDWKFIKMCPCGSKINKNKICINSVPNILEERVKLNKVRVPPIFQFENTPCLNRSLIKNNTFSFSDDFPAAPLVIDNYIKSLTRENVNEQNWKGDTPGHKLLLFDYYHKHFHLLESLYELGLDIFIKNKSGFCLAHIYDIHRHFVKWFSEKNSIDPYEEYTDQEFLENFSRKNFS